ncbi:MAG: RNA polymerase factor sigma-32 [Pseudomonadota bacterium]
MVTTISANTAHDERAMIRSAMQAPMLEKQHELNLARRWRDEQDEDALAELTQSYLRLVISMATRFRHYGLPRGDLIQEGVVGLMEAAQRFEPERDIRFSTYASWWIRSAIQDFILRNWSIVRTGTTAAHKSLFFNLRRLRAQIEGASDGPMSADARNEMAKTLGVRLKDVETMESRLTGGDRSLNTTMTEDGESEWQDFLPCEAPLPDAVVSDRLDGVVRTQLISDAMSRLNEREATIIRERRLSEQTVTLSALGERMGISKERVRQIETQALNKLKAQLAGKFPEYDAERLVSAS